MSNRNSHVNENHAALRQALVRPRPWAQVVRYSTRSQFGVCAQRWAWEHVEGLRPKTAPRPLAFGDLVHRGLAATYRHLDDPDPAIGPAEGLREMTAWAFDRAREAAHDPDGRMTMDECEAMISLAGNLVRRNVAKYWDRDRAAWTLVGVEVPFRLPINVPGRRTLSRIDAAGTMDLVVRTKAAGEYVIVDHKTTATATKDRFVAALQCDVQRVGYSWALRQALDSLGEPWPVAGMVYNVLRKKEVREPATTQCARCKGTGLAKDHQNANCAACVGSGVGGVSKAVCDTLPSAYHALKVRYPHLDLAPVQPLIDALTARGDTFDWREFLWVDPGEWTGWISETYDAARLMAEAVRSGRYVRNRRECVPFAGSPCPYRGLCERDAPEVRGVFEQRVPQGLRDAGEQTVEDEDAADAVPF